MKVKSIELKNFRNYTEQKVDLSGGLNVIFGSNASGKTNLVESVYYAGLGKSPRGTKDKELIRWNGENAYIKVVLEKKYRDHTIEIFIDSLGKKRIAIDRLPVRKISELIGVMNVVYFSPDELDIIKEGPQERRRFLDISLSQQRRTYFTDLVRYNKILAQRNKLLKNYTDIAVIKETLPIWDTQLAKVGAGVIKSRYDLVAKLDAITKEEHSRLTSGKEVVDLCYESKIQNGAIEDIEREYLELLTKSWDKDIYMHYTTFGAHREDMSITVDGVDLRKYGSQGQKRTTALSLKLAEVKLFVEEVGEKPVLILDDVLSELDQDRQRCLLEEVSEVQTLLTCTEYAGEADRLIRVQNGEVVEIK